MSLKIEGYPDKGTEVAVTVFADNDKGYTLRDLKNLVGEAAASGFEDDAAVTFRWGHYGLPAAITVMAGGPERKNDAAPF